MVQYANIAVTSNLKSCKSLSNATCRSRVIAYSFYVYPEVSLTVLRAMPSVGKQHHLIICKLSSMSLLYVVKRTREITLKLLEITIMIVFEPPSQHVTLPTASIAKKKFPPPQKLYF